MSDPLSVIKEALAPRPEPLPVVTSVNGLNVKLATIKGGVNAVSTVKLSVGDKVQLINGVAYLVPKTNIVIAV